MTGLLRSPRARWILATAAISAAVAIAVTQYASPSRISVPPSPQPAASTQSPASTQPPNTRSTFALTTADIDRLAKQANSGSGAAAYRLALYYETVRHDYPEAKRWMKASAENGDLGGMYGYAGYLKISTDPDERASARIWLEKVAAKGDDVSKLAARRDLRQLDAGNKAER